MLGFVYFVERRLHLTGRIYVFQLYLIYPNAQIVSLGQFLHSRERLDLNVLPPDGDQFVNRAVSHHLTHRGFGQIAESLSWIADIEQILARVFDAILHDPLDQCGIQITGNHGFFLIRIRPSLNRIRSEV